MRSKAKNTPNDHQNYKDRRTRTENLQPGQEMGSRQWLGHRQEGPGTETLGEEQTQQQTANLPTQQELGEGPLVMKALGQKY